MTIFAEKNDPVSDGRQSVEKPASPIEIAKFKRNLDDTAKTFIELDFPVVEIELHSRQFYEAFFNRIAWDLAMWEPSQLAPSGKRAFYSKKTS